MTPLDALVQSCFLQSQLEHSLLIRKVGQKIAVVLMYIDDLLITCNDNDLMLETKNTLQQAFKIKDMGELKFFLGIVFAKSKQGIFINQRKYALQLTSESGPEGAKLSWTPLECNVKLTSK